MIFLPVFAAIRGPLPIICSQGLPLATVSTATRRALSLTSRLLRVNKSKLVTVSVPGLLLLILTEANHSRMIVLQ